MSELALQGTTESDGNSRLRGSHLHQPTPTLQRRLEDRQFLVMESAYRSTGGLVSGDQLARLMRRRSQQPISMLARLIVSREVLSFEWQSQTMLPLFQFDLSTMGLRPNVNEIVRELSDVFDDWSLALWFAEPNMWLANSAPVQVIEVNANEVREAARADRLIACG